MQALPPRPSQIPHPVKLGGNSQGYAYQEYIKWLVQRQLLLTQLGGFK